jgi:serine/threonine protein kinase
MIDRGLPTPRPWLVLHRRRWGFAGVGYLLCDLVADARNLHDAARKTGPVEREQLTDTLARWVRLMHDRGISHRDLKAPNILVRADGACEFIDLVGVRTRRRVPRVIRIRDLARLNASFVASPHVTWRDRVRFLQTYLLRGLRGPGDWKDWGRQVFAATEAKVRRNERRNRPLA